jgi:signal transduction histidine kinase
VRTFFVNTFWRYGAWIACALLSIATFFVCAVAANNYRDISETQFRRETSNIAKLLIGYFDDSIVFTDELLLHIVSDYASIEEKLSDNPQVLHELLKGHAPASSTAIALLSATDKNGMLIATANAYPFSPYDVANKNDFIFHANDPIHSKLYISAPEYGRVSQQWIVRISRPLKKKDGTFAGVLAASYKISYFLALLEKLNIKDIGLVALTGRDGIIRVQSYGGKLSYGLAVPAKTTVFARVQSGEKQGGFDELSGIDQKRRIGYFATSEVVPFHVYVGYDYSPIEMEHYRVVMLLGAIWFLFSGIMFFAIVFAERMANVRQQSRVAAIESIVIERKRILSDMHDSIGASLAVLISHLNSGGGDWIQLKRKATQILTELRLLVDSVGGQDTDANAVLASVRHRMQSGIELAGINIIWRVDQLPVILSLTPQDALSLRLIIMEALSNVIHHSHANSVTLFATYDKTARLLTITVEDDGRGFIAATSSKGVGLKNMEARAQKLTWPTTIHIESKPGKGTAVQIKMELPADVKTIDGVRSIQNAFIE